MQKTIAIIYHEMDRQKKPRTYVISFLADVWREEGHHVIELFGIDEFVPADIAILHVDLSVIPEAYMHFANQYPVVLNGKVKDIRKSSFTELRLTPNDSYNGPVIAKSNLNYSGRPERFLKRYELSKLNWFKRFSIKVKNRLRNERLSFQGNQDYQVFDHLARVPAFYFEHSDIIVEKFISERDDGLFSVRCFHFLGDAYSCTRLTSNRPIVNGTSQIRLEQIVPDAEILAIRDALKFDYGKFDYVMHHGKASLLDANKTIGATALSDTPELTQARRKRAHGLYAYFRDLNPVSAVANQYA